MQKNCKKSPGNFANGCANARKRLPPAKQPAATSSGQSPDRGYRRSTAAAADADNQPPDRVKVRLRLRRDELGDAIGIHEVGKTRLLFEIDKRRVAP